MMTSNARTPDEARRDILALFDEPIRQLQHGLALAKPQEQARRRAALGYLKALKADVERLVFVGEL